jgi:hypothetical protein
MTFSNHVPSLSRALLAFALAFMSPHLHAQTVTIAGQLLK